MPQYLGGRDKLFEYLQEVEDMALDKVELDGSCFSAFQFIVEEDGTCTDWKVARTDCDDFADEMVKIFDDMNPWIPGVHLGQKRK
ncbi:MAG: hypothetical protein IPN29_05995 [Saprospiraceae bacterium]|nr:hypothetical protein [Saprospiraceae bacterium]